MPNSHVRKACVYAVVAWVVTTMFILSGTIVGLVHPSGRWLAVSLSLFAHGLVCSAAAATLTLRNLVLERDSFIQTAFELGRSDSGGTVRRIQ